MTYFKPWRHKLGVVTLLMACVFMALWVRSRSENDTIAVLFSDKVKYEAISKRGTLCFQQKSGPFVRFGPVRFLATSKVQYPPPTVKFDDHPFQECRNGTEWRWKWGGFDIGKGTEFPAPVNVIAFQIPYWSIVLLPTLLSVYLLLSKPRTKSGPTQN